MFEEKKEDSIYDDRVLVQISVCFFYFNSFFMLLYFHGALCWYTSLFLLFRFSLCSLFLSTEFLFIYVFTEKGAIVAADKAPTNPPETAVIAADKTRGQSRQKLFLRIWSEDKYKKLEKKTSISRRYKFYFKLKTKSMLHHLLNFLSALLFWLSFQLQKNSHSLAFLQYYSSKVFFLLLFEFNSVKRESLENRNRPAQRNNVFKNYQQWYWFRETIFNQIKLERSIVLPRIVQHHVELVTHKDREVFVKSKILAHLFHLWLHIHFPTFTLFPYFTVSLEWSRRNDCTGGTILNVAHSLLSCFQAWRFHEETWIEYLYVHPQTYITFYGNLLYREFYADSTFHQVSWWRFLSRNFSSNCWATKIFLFFLS